MAPRGRKKELTTKLPPGPKPDPPECLSPGGLELWEKYSDTINRLGLLESIDDYGFAMLCDSIATLEDMRAHFARDGSYTNLVGENGALQVNPICQLIAQQSKAVLALASEFGMTPRGRISLTGSLSVNPDAAALDPMEALLRELTEPLPSSTGTAKRPKKTQKKPAKATPKPTRKKAAKKPKRKTG